VRHALGRAGVDVELQVHTSAAFEVLAARQAVR